MCANMWAQRTEEVSQSRPTLSVLDLLLRTQTYSSFNATYTPLSRHFIHSQISAQYTQTHTAAEHFHWRYWFSMLLKGNLEAVFLKKWVIQIDKVLAINTLLALNWNIIVKVYWLLQGNIRMKVSATERHNNARVQGSNRLMFLESIFLYLLI